MTREIKWLGPYTRNNLQIDTEKNMTVISIDKKYRTYDGREVRIYAMDGDSREPIHGALRDYSGNWNHSAWFITGENIYKIKDANLVEVKPRIERTYWANLHHEGPSFFYETKSLADTFDGGGRIACVKVEIDCEEGEGL